MNFDAVNGNINCVDERKMSQSLKLNKNVKSNLVQFHTLCLFVARCGFLTQQEIHWN